MYIQNRFFQSFWQETDDSFCEDELAVIVALVRFSYVKDDELIEIESNIFYDPNKFAEELSRLVKLLPKHIEIEEKFIIFFSAIKSFVDTNCILEIGQLSEDAFFKASRFHIGKMQTLRSIGIPLSELNTEHQALKFINSVKIF